MNKDKILAALNGLQNDEDAGAFHKLNRECGYADIFTKITAVHKIGGTNIFNCASDHTEDILRGWLIDLDTLEYESVSI